MTKITVNHYFTTPLVNCVTYHDNMCMIGYGKMRGLIQGPTHSVVRTHNLGRIGYKEQFMVNGIMHDITIQSLTSKCCHVLFESHITVPELNSILLDLGQWQ